MTTALTRRARRARPARPAHVVALAILALALAILTALLPARADAAYLSASSGRLGSISLQGPRLAASDLARQMANGYYSYSKHFTAGALSVAPSPSSSGWQTVTVRSMVQRWDYSRWTTIAAREVSRYAGGSQWAGFPEWTWSPPTYLERRELYRVMQLVTWTDYSTGRLLAYTVVVPSTTADNACRTRWVGCTSNTHSVRF
jgi:hypothetical protein